MNFQSSSEEVVSMEVNVPSGFSVMEVLEMGVERLRQQKARKLALTRAVRLPRCCVSFCCVLLKCRGECGIRCNEACIDGEIWGTDLHEVKGVSFNRRRVAERCDGDDSVENAVADEFEALI